MHPASLALHLAPLLLPVLSVRCRFGITRAHLEEDAGKTVYGGADRLAGSEYSLVDYNRAGEGTWIRQGAVGSYYRRLQVEVLTTWQGQGSL